MKRSFLPVSGLATEPYSSILGFPRATKRQLQSRAAELESLGVSKIAFWGPVRIGTLGILGKGYVGVVVLGRLGGRTVAVKIRRTDSPRKSLAGESQLLGKANGAGVGPRLVAGSRNFLVMEYLRGRRISDWAADLGGLSAAAVEEEEGEVKATLAKILHDCFVLDTAGIDHGELGVLSKHVIIGKKTTIIDFESSSTRRRPSNITSATQGLFIGSGIARAVSRVYKIPPKRQIIGALRRYKHDISVENYENLLAVLKIG